MALVKKCPVILAKAICFSSLIPLALANGIRDEKIFYQIVSKV